ncbi:NitT/TauT family transport system permease protein [Arthrobacter sp. UYP6]|uniref:ABC transporter permease n=1 Tax=Arthrobacter sp. UYP6 TaxID=1756378 RepID=UPI00339958B9
MSSAAGAAGPAGPAARIGWAAGGVLAPVLLWEGYKFAGPESGVSLAGMPLLPRTSDLAMPHIWTMLARLAEPVTSAAGAVPLWAAVLQAAAFTLGIAALGWLIGVVVGTGLAMVMQRFRSAGSALLPWIILSQTVPLIAIAPLVRRWGSQLEIGSFTWENWMSVAVIASYLAFFPVAIGALRGFSSPQGNHLDLMYSYAVGWWRSFLFLRLPASIPFLLPALRLAAANAVIGAVVAEVSIGLKGGIGRMIVEYAAAAGGDPGKPWAPIFGAVLLGLAAVAATTVLGLFLHG